VLGKGSTKIKTSTGKTAAKGGANLQDAGEARKGFQYYLGSLQAEPFIDSIRTGCEKRVDGSVAYRRGDGQGDEPKKKIFVMRGVENRYRVGERKDQPPRGFS